MMLGVSWTSVTCCQRVPGPPLTVILGAELHFSDFVTSLNQRCRIIPTFEPIFQRLSFFPQPRFVAVLSRTFLSVFLWSLIQVFQDFFLQPLFFVKG